MKNKKAIVGIYVSCLHVGVNAKYSITVERRSPRKNSKAKKRVYEIDSCHDVINMIGNMVNDGKLTTWMHLGVYPTFNFHPADYDILTGWTE